HRRDPAAIRRQPGRSGKRQLSHRLGELAELVGGTVVGDAELEIEGLNTLEEAGPRELSFLTNPRYLERARTSRAAALVVSPGLEGLDRARLEVENPYLAVARILTELHPPRRPQPGVHPTAELDDSVELGADVSVGAFCSIGAGSSIGEGTVVHPHVVVGTECRIGAGCVVHPLVSIYDGTILGRNVIVHSGVVLGADGFGYAQSDRGHVKIPQVGRVVVEDEVEIGANSTVDRAMLRETRVGRGSKIDNLVMVAHNVEIGERCLLIAQVGVAGSARLGDDVVLAGQVGVVGHMDVGDGVQVASKSAIMKPAEAGAELAGVPAIDSMEWRRQLVRLGRLGDLEKRVKALERELADLVHESNGDE
ncbi:MAG: UDP-3-O-(3-hydroxymyristoyl)glucosamine N-acyltransferase, partial [Thermoanaerobaculia bacterium]|nr:UDP-3-O-(3-hydroxymyristoyl)glucosamine N-acyltransferase [Thermoanaerobaculia bacterium]